MGGVEQYHTVRQLPSATRPRTGASELLDNWRLQLVRAHGTCPREEPNLFVSLVLPVKQWSGPASTGIYRFPTHEGMGSACWPLSCAVCRIWHPTIGYLAPGNKPEALHWVSCPEIPTEWEERLTRWTLGGQSTPKEGVALLLFPVEVVTGVGERGDDERTASARARIFECHREPPERGKQGYHAGGTA